MNIKEQIRAEIERRLSWRITLEARAAYNNILRFLDTLPEQPVPTIMTNEMLMGEIKPKKKSNALFDKCVENCDPAIMKEVSDNVDKMLGRQPVEGLEDEIKLYFDGWSDNTEYGQAVNEKGVCVGVEDCEDIARHFAEWGADHLRDTTKMVDEGLEEAAEEYADGPECSWVGTSALEDAFKAGAEWIKSKYEK